MTNISEKEIYEIFLKTLSPSLSTSIILKENKFEYLLLEELDQSDVEKLRQHSKELMQSLDSYISATKTAMPSVSSWLEANKKSVQAANDLAAKIDLEDPEGVAKLTRFFGSKTEPKRALQAILDIESKLATALSSFEKSSELFGKNLEDKIDPATPLKDIPAEAGVSVDQLKQGYRKSFKKSKPGMFAKIANFFKGGAIAKIPGAEEIPEFPVDEASEEVVNLSLEELQSLLKNTNDVPPPDPQATEDIASDAPAPEQAGEDKDGDGKPDEAKEDKKPSGKEFPNIDKLAALGTKVFGKNGDTVIRNFFADDEVRKLFGESVVYYKGSLTNILFEQEDLIDFEVFSKKLKSVGTESEVSIDDKESADFAVAANDILSKKIKVPGETGEDEAGDDSGDETGGEESAEETGGTGEEKEAKGEDNKLPEEEKEAADEQAEEVASQLGSGPVKKNALASILKSFPDITGKGNKATRSRRAFRKAINQAAGKEIFEESFDRSPQKAAKAILLLVEGQSLQKESNKIFSRWNALAGVEE